MIRLAVLTALWTRPSLTEAVLAYYSALNVPGVDLCFVAVRSPEDPDPAADVPGWSYTHAPNGTADGPSLSDKWNAGMAACRGADAVMIVGSDDFVSADYIAEAARHIEAGAEGPLPVRPLPVRPLPVRPLPVLVQARTALFTDGNESLLCVPSRMGGGRVLSARLLEACDWRPWPSGRMRGLDGAMDSHLSSLGIDYETVTVEPDDLLGDPPHLVAVKDETNLWGMEALRACAIREYAGVPEDVRSSARVFLGALGHGHVNPDVHCRPIGSGEVRLTGNQGTVHDVNSDGRGAAGTDELEPDRTVIERSRDGHRILEIRSDSGPWTADDPHTGKRVAARLNGDIEVARLTDRRSERRVIPPRRVVGAVVVGVAGDQDKRQNDHRAQDAHGDTGIGGHYGE